MRKKENSFLLGENIGKLASKANFCQRLLIRLCSDNIQCSALESGREMPPSLGSFVLV